MVHPRHRRKGVGRELVRKSLVLFRRYGVRKIYASMASGRAEAIGLLRGKDFNFQPDPQSEAEVHYWARGLWKVYIGFTDRICAEEPTAGKLRRSRYDVELPFQGEGTIHSSASSPRLSSLTCEL